MHPKRVLLTRSDVRLAGPGILMFAIACALQERGHHVEIAVGCDALTQRFKDAGFAVHIVPGMDLGDRSPLRMARGVMRMRQIAADLRVDVVHSFNAQAGLLAWIATIGLNLNRVKVVNTVLGAGKEGLLKRLPFKLIAVSDFVKRDLISRGVSADRITTVLNSIITEDRVLADNAAFDQAWRKRRKTRGKLQGGKGEFRLVGIAMMNGDKGHYASIEAFARWVERSSPNGIARRASLTFVGDGTRRTTLEAFAKQRGVGDQVRFIGALDNVFPELDRAHAFLHLSPQETFGMVLAEAHARGLPAISYAIGGIPEVVADGQSGILCALDDLDAVTDAVEQLAENPDQCAAMGRAGLERVRGLFMRGTLGEGIESAYASL